MKKTINELVEFIVPDYVGLTDPGLGYCPEEDEGTISFYKKLWEENNGPVSTEMVKQALSIASEAIDQARDKSWEEAFSSACREAEENGEIVILCGDYSVPRVVDRDHELSKFEFTGYIPD